MSSCSHEAIKRVTKTIHIQGETVKVSWSNCVICRVQVSKEVK